MTEGNWPADNRPLSLLAAKAPDFGATVVLLDDTRAILKVPIPHTDGVVESFELTVEANNCGSITVRERQTVILPVFCPERHLNSDGSFCLAWSEDVDLTVSNEDASILWWESLVQFLRKQRRAKKSRRWPDDDAWAHGAAAQHQRVAEEAATRLGPDFVADLKARKISVKKTKYKSRVNGPVLNVMRGEKLAYSVWERQFVPINYQRACICVRGDVKLHRRLRNCSKTHGKDAQKLVQALVSWEEADAEFWADIRGCGWQCCGTIDGCPLQKTSGSIL